MKAIIQSYTPQECERIINGRQTIKVCKNAPKDTLFKVYIYCTKKGDMFFHGGIGEKQVLYYNPDEKRYKFDYPLELMCCKNKYTKDNFLSGKVIGEYVCEKVDVAEVGGKLLGLYNSRFVDASDFSLIVKRCLDNSELSNYSRGKSISCLHISNVKIYDKPKELSEFGKYVKKQNIIDKGCEVIIENWTEFEPIRRPPHGWQYVEEVQ